MKRTVWITLLAILGFAVILIARMPVSWVSGFIPRNVTCAELDGTVWEGSCSGLVAENIPVGNVTWQLRPMALLSRKLAGYFEVTRDANFVRGNIEASANGTITAHDLQADMPLDHALIPQLPRDLTGSVRVNLGSIHIEKNTVMSVQGLIEAHDLVQGSGNQRTTLGDFSVTFPAADPSKEPVGQLQSLTGPLDVEGTLRLTRAPGYVLEGLVAAKPEAPPSLVKELSYLGSPDAQGRRPFSVDVSF